MKHLRELAKDFAQGKITQEEYREKRRKLIQGILCGDVQIPRREFPTPLPPSPDNHFFPGDREDSARVTTQIFAIQPQTKNKKKPPPLSTPTLTTSTNQKFSFWLLTILGITILMLSISIAVLFVIVSMEENSTKTLSKHSSAADNLIRNFLALNNWQLESLQKFRADWERLGPQKQMMASSLPIMHELRNAIYRKILEEQTMFDLATTESSREKQRQLVDLAHDVGITDPSIRVTPQPP